MTMRQWGWPLALAGSTLLGLVCALIGGGGLWWGISWIGLAMPLLMILHRVVTHALRRLPGLT